MDYLSSECCGDMPDERFYFNYTWKLGICSSCQDNAEFIDISDDIDEE